MEDLKKFIASQNLNFVIVSDAEPRINEKQNGRSVFKPQAGGVAIALDPVALASKGVFIGRGKTKEDRTAVNSRNEIKIKDKNGAYTLKRVFLTEEEMEGYYYGFSNQTIWPLSHVAFETPEFNKTWYEAYKKVNRKFADAIKTEIKGDTFIWINDYQLALVPKLIDRPEKTIVAMFWHIPWPTWEVFRIMPQKKDILISLLSCDFLAFHRGYHVKNFLETVERELQARIDEETGIIYYKNHVTTVKNLPLGIDTDVVKRLVHVKKDGGFFANLFKNKKVENSKENFDGLFGKDVKIILGVDRVDYTKGLKLRMVALDKFFTENSKYIGKVTYLGILSNSRQQIPAYRQLREDLNLIEDEINAKYAKYNLNWKPVHLIYETFPREKIINFYKKASCCLVTPRDDGMNLVSKEFVVASSFLKDPGMLVLSQFAGSAIDLKQSLIVNPYDIDEVAGAIKTALEMDKKDKMKRIKDMAEVLEEKNIYEWAMQFIKGAQSAIKEKQIV